MTNTSNDNLELMEITFLKDHPQSGNSPGSISRIDSKFALKLIQLGYARSTTEEDKIKPEPVKYVEVIFLRHHPKYAYFPGDFGTINSEHAEDMVDLGYVELIENKN